MALVEQTYFNIVNSITTNSDNPIDNNSPLILTDWLKYFNQSNTDILSEYNKYLIRWFQVKNTTTDTQSTTITNLYIDLFKSIAVNYTTFEEHKFLQNVDYTDIKQVIAVLPFFVKKIKDICLYYVWLRENAKTNTIKNNLRGSDINIEKVIYNEFISSLYDTDIQNALIQSNISIEDIKRHISIDIEPLYDTTNYFDASANSYDPSIFYNFDQAVNNQIKTYPTYINGLSSFFSITLDESTLNLSLLKDKDFITTFNNNDVSNLNLNTLATLIPQYVGTDFYYLSTNSTGTTYVSGILFEATQKPQNILNKRYPTTATNPLTSNLLSKREMGGFFTPEHMGVVNFYSFSIKYKTKDLKPNTVYTFPDPNKYGNITNLTQISYDSPFIFTDDISFTKISNTNTASRGSVVSDPYLKTFYAYTSRSENLQSDLANIERYSDPQDFFTGNFDSNWSNVDVYPLTTQNKYPIDTRYNSLLVDNSRTLTQHKTDIYGNQFGQFKKIKVQVDPNTVALKPTNTCLIVDGGLFTNTTSYTTTLLLAISSFDQLNTPENYLIAPLFSSENFCAAEVNINLASYSGGIFNQLSNYPQASWFGGLFNGLVGDLTSSGTFLINGEDQSAVAQPDSDYRVLPADISTQTQLISVVDTLTDDLSLYAEREQTYGSVIVRLANNTVTSLEVAFVDIFNNLDGNIVYEISEKLKTFDVVYNNFIFETEHYVGFIQFNFDINTAQFKLLSNSVQYIESSSTYEKISSPWYNDKDNSFIIVKLKNSVDSNNYQLIYPEIYKQNSSKIDLIFPGISTTYNQLSTFSVYTTDYKILFTSVETPVVTYNTNLDRYLVSFIARDSSNLVYLFNYYFKLNTEVYDISVNFFKPQCFCHSENFSGNELTSIANIQTYTHYTSGVSLSGGYLIFS